MVLAMKSAGSVQVLRRVFTVDPLPDPSSWLAYSRLSPEAARSPSRA
ncbi:hypothetical protein M1P56_35195 (plasmid) [Streptomyces sp. HU2014]|nr:hypothetical protein [Streptomyces sp. HU2014]UQI49760.1 hypothetical protein M1P56_35195 [Streptomyces sp. HU2014]